MTDITTRGSEIGGKSKKLFSSDDEEVLLENTSIKEGGLDESAVHFDSLREKKGPKPMPKRRKLSAKTKVLKFPSAKATE